LTPVLPVPCFEVLRVRKCTQPLHTFLVLRITVLLLCRRSEHGHQFGKSEVSGFCCFWISINNGYDFCSTFFSESCDAWRLGFVSRLPSIRLHNHRFGGKPEHDPDTGWKQFDI